MYRKLLDEYKRNPRDVHTDPITRVAHKWFYVFVQNNTLYVAPARDNAPKCAVKKRMLSEKECSTMLELYHRRKHGERVSAEAQACTYSQVYWYGIFADLNL